MSRNTGAQPRLDRTEQPDTRDASQVALEEGPLMLRDNARGVVFRC